MACLHWSIDWLIEYEHTGLFDWINIRSMDWLIDWIKMEWLIEWINWVDRLIDWLIASFKSMFILQEHDRFLQRPPPCIIRPFKFHPIFTSFQHLLYQLERKRVCFRPVPARRLRWSPTPKLCPARRRSSTTRKPTPPWTIPSPPSILGVIYADIFYILVYG